MVPFPVQNQPNGINNFGVFLFSMTLGGINGTFFLFKTKPFLPFFMTLNGSVGKLFPVKSFVFQFLPLIFVHSKTYFVDPSRCRNMPDTINPSQNQQ